MNDFSLCQRELQGWSGKSRVSEKTLPKRQKSNKTAKLPLISSRPGVKTHSLYTFGGLVKNKSPKKIFYYRLYSSTVMVEREESKNAFLPYYSASSRIIGINPQLYTANFIIYPWAVDLISATCYAKNQSLWEPVIRKDAPRSIPAWLALSVGRVLGQLLGEEGEKSHHPPSSAVNPMKHRNSQPSKLCPLVLSWHWYLGSLSIHLIGLTTNSTGGYSRLTLWI